MHNPFLILNSAFVTALQCELGQANCNTIWIYLLKETTDKDAGVGSGARAQWSYVVSSSLQ